ncbi:hypothetical protein HC031_29630 [Planosporangium thailandense]|uniref:Uncharacterized protein n=1 Tax=Planosporangium thailandense TaxID=765197 RepID=A0ABX0Y610_9ACTN|nr:hypothetical protein [Planosporangium thailandense]NJC73844.1 hypothetical protein [Planosporangium thailandense]
MNEADRIARANAEKARQQELSERRANERRHAEEQNAKIAAIQAEIPAVMKLLAGNGYRDGEREVQQVEVSEHSFFRGYKYVKKGGWLVLARSVDKGDGSQVEHTVHLLSDGRLVYGSVPIDLRKLAFPEKLAHENPVTLTGILTGLRNMRKRLENAERQ